MLIYNTLLSFIFLYISSILTETRYNAIVVLITLAVFTLLFLFIHLLQFPKLRWVMGAIAGLLITLQVILFLTKKGDTLHYNKEGLVVYRGLPLPYFDVMINPNGTFRFVDKKEHFNSRDKLTILKKNADIIIFGTGDKLKKEIGFNKNMSSFFTYNSENTNVSQVIVMNTRNACEKYNNLNKLGYKVLLIIHQ